MSDVRNFAELTPNIGFSEFDFYELYRSTFEKSELGRMNRHPHGKRGAAGGQDRTESTAGGLLKRKYAHRKVLSPGNYASVIENEQAIRPKRPERDIKTEI